MEGSGLISSCKGKGWWHDLMMNSTINHRAT